MSPREVDIEEVIPLCDAGSPTVDVRVRVESDAGHIAVALHIPLCELADRADGGRS